MNLSLRDPSSLDRVALSIPASIFLDCLDYNVCSASNEEKCGRSLMYYDEDRECAVLKNGDVKYPRDLAIDFRPPSSGKGDYPNVKPVHYGWYVKSLPRNIYRFRVLLWIRRPHTILLLCIGREYRDMIADITTALDQLENWVPGYNATRGYQLAGLVWFQGWNDMVDTSWRKIKEYSFNMANFIRDIRDDLDAPEMPVVIGGMGQLGMHPTGR